MQIDKSDQIVILAGGLGKRLGKLTKKLPKSLLPFQNKPFIYHQITFLKKNGFKNVLILIGHKGNKIVNEISNFNIKNLKISYSYDGKKNLGTGGALKKAKNKLFNNFFLVYGDTFPRIDFHKLKKHHINKEADYTIVLHKNNNKLDKSNIVLKNRKIIRYNKNSKSAIHIDYGVSILNKDILNNFKKRSFDLGLITEEFIKKKKLNYLIENKRFYEIGSLKGINQFNKFLKKHERN